MRISKTIPTLLIFPLQISKLFKLSNDDSNVLHYTTFQSENSEIIFLLNFKLQLRSDEEIFREIFNQRKKSPKFIYPNYNPIYSWIGKKGNFVKLEKDGKLKWKKKNNCHPRNLVRIRKCHLRIKYLAKFLLNIIVIFIGNEWCTWKIENAMKMCTFPEILEISICLKR